MIKAVVFDLDDTLAPEMGFVRSGYKAVARRLAVGGAGDLRDRMKGEPAERIIEKLEKNIYRILLKLFEEDHRQVFNRLLDSIELPYGTEDIGDFITLYREHEIFSELYGFYEDVPEILESLEGMGIKTGILTDGFVVSQKHKLETLGIIEAQDSGEMKIRSGFDAVVITGELGKEYEKPSEAGFLECAKRLGVEPSEMMYVGDNPEKDFYIKKSLPIKTVRIMRPEGVYLDAQYREDITEDIRIEELGELLQHV